MLKENVVRMIQVTNQFIFHQIMMMDGNFGLFSIENGMKMIHPNFILINLTILSKLYKTFF